MRRGPRWADCAVCVIILRRGGVVVCSEIAAMLSLSDIADRGEETLALPPACEGRVWLHKGRPGNNPRHRHAELEFNLVVRGSASYLVGERRHEMRRGVLLWLFPAHDHVLLEQSPDFAMWIVVFRPALLLRLCDGDTARPLAARDAPARYVSVLGEPSLARLDPLLRELAVAAPDPPRHNAGLGWLLFSAWDAHTHAGDAPQGAGVHPAVERVARLLRDETDPLSVEEMARQAGLSAGSLSRLFRAQTGQSIAAFRNRQRIERFLRLRETGTPTLLEAALAAGWGSYPQFHRVFKATMGCAPADYGKLPR